MAADVGWECEDCGEPGSACPGRGKVVCQSCAEADGEVCRCFPVDLGGEAGAA